MLLIEWIILISISATIVVAIMILVFLLTIIRKRREITLIAEAKPKKRRSQRRWGRQLKSATVAYKKNQRQLWLAIGLLLLSASIGGYSKHYQITNMTVADTENIVSGYYLVSQMEEQLNLVGKEELAAEQSSSNIHTLAIRMASFSAKKGNDRAAEAGQLLLNRYYARVGQFGVNLSSQPYEELVKQPIIIEDYKADIANIKKAQKNLLEFYKINESSLSEKK